jgi:hypothetical protein
MSAARFVHYRLLETTRAYAREKLIGSAEFDHFTRRHAEYLRDLFQHAEAELETRPTVEWLAAYRLYIDDLRTALDWAFSPTGDVGVGVALTAATVPLWTQLSLLTECRARVEQAIASLGRQVPSDPRRDMRLYLALGHAILHTRSSGGQEMNAAYTRALELAEILDDTRYRLGAIFGLYAHRLTSGGYRDALGLAEKFCTVATETAAHSDVRSAADSSVSRCTFWETSLARDDTSSRWFARASRRLGRRTSACIEPTSECYSIPTTGVFSGCRDVAIRRGRLTESLVEYVRTKDHVLSCLYAVLTHACPIALYVGDLTTADHHVRLAFDLAARHALEVWNDMAQCFEGAVLISEGINGAGSQLLQSALERLPEPTFITT